MARDLLEATHLPMERVAEKPGFGSATNLRLHVTTQVGIPPNLHRKQFREAGTRSRHPCEAWGRP